MKRLLYGTTALATVGMIAGVAGDAAAAERLKLGIGGYHQQWGIYADQDVSGFAAGNDTNPVDEKHNSEICFIGETTLDTGITFGVNVQMDANTDGDQIDESYLYVQSPSMGQLILGDENNAGYLLHVTAPDGGVSLDSGDLVNIEAFVIPVDAVFDTALGTTFLRFDDNDSGKFTYLTPRFAGLQAGVSFIPEFEGGGDNNSSLRIVGSGNQTSGPAVARNRGINNGWAGGLNFVQDFTGFGVKASVGALTGQASADDSFGGDDDLFAWDVGAQVTLAGFSFGGGYVRADGDRATGAVTGVGVVPQQFNSSSWTVGAAYEIGPYKVGIDYMKGQSNIASGVGGQQHLTQAVLSGTYTLGPGIRLVGGVFAFDGESEENALENDGWGVATGFKLGF